MKQKDQNTSYAIRQDENNEPTIQKKKDNKNTKIRENRLNKINIRDKGE